MDYQKYGDAILLYQNYTTIVGKFKLAMNKMARSGTDIGLNFANWLLNYHNTPHSVTGVEPAVRMLGRRIRSALSLVNPLSSSRSLVKRENQILEAERTLRRFSVGDAVLYRDVLHKEWKRGIVREVSDKQYVIATDDGSDVTKHIDHVVKSTSVPAEEARESEHAAGRGYERQNVQSTPVIVENDQTRPSSSLSRQDSTLSKVPSNGHARLIDRPKRVSKPPDRLEYDKLGGP